MVSGVQGDNYEIRAELNPKPATFEVALDTLYRQMRQLLLYKRGLRGTANITSQGLAGVVLRVSEDKLTRVKEFIKAKGTAAILTEWGLWSKIQDSFPTDKLDDKSVDDDLMDAANYCMIAVLLRRGYWELP